MANITERIEKAIGSLEDWLNREYDEPRKRGKKPRLIQCYTGCFEPTLHDIRRISEELEVNGFVTAPLERHIAAFSDCTLEVDKLVMEVEVDEAYKKLDSLAYHAENLKKVLRLLADKQKNAGTNAGQRKQRKPKLPAARSRPLSTGKWAEIFEVSENTIRKWREEKKYHFRQVSPRRWTLPINELPAEYLEKYRSSAQKPK